MTVGERIRQRRQELEMTQHDLAKLMGVTDQLISRYENNAVDTIPTRKLKRVADILRCSPYELMEGFTDEKPLTPKQIQLIERVKLCSPDEVARLEVVFDAMMIPRL